EIGLTKETNSNHIGDRIKCAIRVSDSSSSLQQSTNDDDDGMVFEPARNLAPQVSIDDCRRLELANILRDKESREALIGQWMFLIEEKNETELLNIEKLLILLAGICDYLDQANANSLEHALDQICNRTTMDSDLRIDLERSFYLFVKAANNVLSSRNFQPPHVLFALDNVIRRIVEQLVGLIRPDFIPAVNTMRPLTVNTDLVTSTSYLHTPTNSPDGLINDEGTRVQQRRTLVEKNEEPLNQWSNIASNERKGESSKPMEVYLPIKTSITTENINPNSSIPTLTGKRKGTHITSISHGIK
ncbi:unnamed protein product, partial [Rotaria sp. Silwood1]